jgi:hypothetical protein
MSDIRFQEGSRNCFRNYGQAENNFTNGLFSMLELSTCRDVRFSSKFFADLLKVDFPQGIESFKVLRGYEESKTDAAHRKPVTVDAIVSGGDVTLFFETKIRSYVLRTEQIKEHLERAIRPGPEKIKKLVLLTPDDPSSDFLKARISIDPAVIIHLRWKDVRDYLYHNVRQLQDSVLDKLVAEYIDVINTTIEEQDYIGIIQKIAFTKKTGMSCPKDCVRELLKPQGWGLPKKRNELDGKGRMLLIYSRNADFQGRKSPAILYEAEVLGCKEDATYEPDFPCRYEINAGSVVEFDPPISLEKVTQLGRFSNFGVRQNAYSNLLRIEYEKLTGGVNKRLVR